MKVKDVLQYINTFNLDYELVISCMTSEYIKKNPTEINVGTLCVNYGCLSFHIDWDNKNKTFVYMLYNYDENIDIISYDADDGNIIEFEELYIDDNNKLFILI